MALAMVVGVIPCLSLYSLYGAPAVGLIDGAAHESVTWSAYIITLPDTCRAARPVV